MKNVPSHAECPYCGHEIKLHVWVYAHWNLELTGTCEGCGCEYGLRGGKTYELSGQREKFERAQADGKSKVSLAGDDRKIEATALPARRTRRNKRRDEHAGSTRQSAGNYIPGEPTADAPKPEAKPQQAGIVMNVVEGRRFRGEGE